ncbi:Alpha-glucosidase 2 [Sarracenia purpurea var. burkii]
MILEEICSQNHFRSSWGGGGEHGGGSYDHHHHAQSQGFFQPLDCNASLQIGYNNHDVPNQISAATHDQAANGFIPGWML